MIRPLLLAAAVAGASWVLPAGAADLFRDDVATVLRTDTFSAEAFVGYVRNSAKEYVYNVPGNGAKLSQLNWDTNGAAVGGRLAVRPFDWLTLRLRGWALVASENAMTDYDWLAGYYGRDSWTHRSHHPDTNSPKAWQIDASAAFALYTADDLAFTAIGGYRSFTQKWRAQGGSFVYSGFGGFRNIVGVFPNDGLGIGYQQWWHTPYAGLGATWTTPTWSAGLEVIGSPFVIAEDKDLHAKRDLLFTEKFGLSGMVGAAASLEYRVSPVLSVVGRVEYQKYLEAKGSTRIVDLASGAGAYLPRPSSGAEADSLLLSLGAKVRL